MATSFAMPVQQFTTSPTQYTLYNQQSQHSQQTSPINSAEATPSNASPTSPRSALPPHFSAPNQQLRPPKSPLYVPAVLRPTDPPKRVARSSPLTPPQSMHSSFDDLDNARKLNRRSTDDKTLTLGSIVEAEWSDQGFGKVTALPTREHWKPDPDSTICDEPTCKRSFTYFTRRHHCRRCGNIFCDLHSMYNTPLDQDANYHPRGFRSRSCEHCWHEYRSWQLARSSRSNSESSHDEPTTPTVSCAGNAARNALGGVFGQKISGLPESLAASVPRDWNWSTF
ncbi:hypothetical protein HYALB_00010622 [Hymenoscyphus albidus]|uniref:FYVE-type domain-containing protein n=1 Tax=Hymenoscyphus albidus TaxID=595503 RepID=A0A9N9Q5G7_9HELO|nr:hypothetical protein HYALB_00010622 [Hymenoscyphus albidus]